MDSLYLLIPLSVVIVLLIAGLMVWSVMSGQFEELESEGRRILDEEPPASGSVEHPLDHQAKLDE